MIIKSYTSMPMIDNRELDDIPKHVYYPLEQYCKHTCWTQPSHLFTSHRARTVEIELYSKCIFCQHTKIEIVECTEHEEDLAVQHAETLGFRDARAPF